MVGILGLPAEAGMAMGYGNMGMNVGGRRSSSRASSLSVEVHHGEGGNGSGGIGGMQDQMNQHLSIGSGSERPGSSLSVRSNSSNPYGGEMYRTDSPAPFGNANSQTSNSNPTITDSPSPFMTDLPSNGSYHHAQHAHHPNHHAATAPAQIDKGLMYLSYRNPGMNNGGEEHVDYAAYGQHPQHVSTI